MKYVKWVLAFIYIYFILTQTVLGRSAQSEPIFQGLFWEIQNGMWSDIWLNILLFVPLGFLIGDWKGILCGFVLSSGIEITQYFCRIGYCELDDILNNTIGSAMGVLLHYAVLKLLSRIKGET